MSRFQSGNNRGFSLIETMVAVAILGVVLAVAVPNFQNSMNRSRFERVGAELQSDIRLAVSKARARGSTMQIVFTANGYFVRDLSDSTTVQTRDFGEGVQISSATDPRFFPWGLAEPIALTVSGPSGGSMNYNLLPSGRLEHP